MKTIGEFASHGEYYDYLQTRPWEDTRYSIGDILEFSRNMFDTVQYLEELRDSMKKIDASNNDWVIEAEAFFTTQLDDLIAVLNKSIDAIEAEADECAENLGSQLQQHHTIWVEFGKMRQL